MRESNSLRGIKTLGPRLAAAFAAALLIAAATGAYAASGTTTSRLHRAHQAESSTAAKSRSSKSSAAHGAAKPTHHPSHSVAQSKPTPSSHRHTPQPPSRLQHDLAIMQRAHSTPRSRAAEARERAAAQPLTQSFPVHPQTSSIQLASTNSKSQSQISAQPPIVAKKTLTTEDFMRAAGETQATVSPVTPAPQPQRAQSERVDGFGAEGANLSSPHYVPPTHTAPAPTEPVDPELAALANPSHEELAESALQPRLPNLYSRNGRLIVPAPLVGSHDVLVHQNEMADSEGLSRIENDSQLASLRAKHLLVDIPESVSLQLNPDLPDNRRCARPWTVKFATDMAHAYFARFHDALQINSAARTVQYQMHLEHINGNAAGVDGDSASPHLTGQAIDFGKRGMSIAEIAWMRAYLKPLMDAGKLDVEEEFHQACFHISVYRSYLPTRKSTPRELAQLATGASTEK
jgi:hypothetical protein